MPVKKGRPVRSISFFVIVFKFIQNVNRHKPLGAWKSSTRAQSQTKRRQDRRRRWRNQRTDYLGALILKLAKSLIDSLENGQLMQLADHRECNQTWNHTYQNRQFLTV